MKLKVEKSKDSISILNALFLENLHRVHLYISFDCQNWESFKCINRKGKNRTVKTEYWHLLYKKKTTQVAWSV